MEKKHVKNTLLADSSERFLDVDTKKYCKTLCDEYTSLVHRYANEPSVGLYRICEHTQKMVPQIQLQRKIVQTQQTNFSEHTYDIEYALVAIKEFAAIPYFAKTNSKVQRMIELVRQYKKDPDTLGSYYESGKDKEEFPLGENTSEENSSAKNKISNKYLNEMKEELEEKSDTSLSEFSVGDYEYSQGNYDDEEDDSANVFANEFIRPEVGNINEIDGGDDMLKPKAF